MSREVLRVFSSSACCNASVTTRTLDNQTGISQRTWRISRKRKLSGTELMLRPKPSGKSNRNKEQRKSDT